VIKKAAKGTSRCWRTAAATRDGCTGRPTLREDGESGRVTATIEPRNRRREWPSDVRRARRSGAPRDPPVTAPYEVIHLGGQAAVIVPLAEFLRLRALESTASAQALDDAEDAAAAQDWLAREARGETNYVPLPEVRRRLGLADSTAD
jgi:hypothetical protein